MSSYYKRVKSGEIVIDFKGHDHYQGKISKETNKYFTDYIVMGLLIYETEKALEKKNSMSKRLDCSIDCSSCGERLEIEFDGKEVKVLNECVYKNGMPPIILNLNVPSGKMVVAEDLREFFPIQCDYDINKICGMYEESKAYSEVGMIHLVTSDNCSVMYKTKSGFTISEKKLKNKVAHINTKWISICDYDAFIAAGGKIGYSEAIVDCEPGVYEFTDYKFVNNGNVEIKRISNSTAVINYRKKYLEENYTLEQMLYEFNKSWDGYLSSFEGDKLTRIQRMLDHVFFTLGNGLDWHPNGWTTCDKLSPSTPSLKIPKLNRKFNWYPNSDYSFVASCAGFGDKSYSKGVQYLNESFYYGLIMCLKNIIEYGDGEDLDNVVIARAAIMGLFEIYSSRVTKNDLAFISKFKLEDALITYKACQKISSSINKATPQNIKSKKDVVIASIENVKGLMQVRNINICVCNYEVGKHTKKVYFTRKLVVTYKKGAILVNGKNIDLAIKDLIIWANEQIVIAQAIHDKK